MKVIKGLVLLCLMMLAGCQSEEETSQFLLACKYDAPATIAAMLDNGIDVDGQDKTGLSGLMVAAAENRRDVVELLLKRRAKPNLQTRQGVTALMLAAIGLADMVSGIFKSNGVLGGLLLDFEPRPRPMFTPSLEGLDITPDSLRVMRREAVPRHWAVHVPPEAVSGMYGTVSAHAATIVALAVLACGAIRRRWFTGLMVVCSVVICYSRIYLGKHFPMDLVWGTLVGAALGYAALRAYRRLIRRDSAAG